jgi:putative tryptophan/tyrosine transport system substrate-binding protein
MRTESAQHQQLTATGKLSLSKYSTLIPHYSVLCLTLCTLLCALSSSVGAQSKIPRVGILFIGGRDQPHLEAFKQGLRDRGYTEGQNILLDYRYAEGNVDRLPSLAAELVQLKVDVIVTTSGNSARAVAETTRTIPIVLTTGADPVRTGLAESLAKPGRNVTGFSLIEEDLSGKRLEILKETFPKLTRMAYLWNPIAVSYSSASSTSGNLSYDQAEKATKTLGVQLLSYRVRTLAEMEKAFADMPKTRPHALLVLQSPLMTLNSKRIVQLALEQHLPGMYPSNQFVSEGGLMAYGPRIGDMYHRAATYVDKILKGAKPADLPIEQPTKFELVINLRTAKQIGVTIPQWVLVKADRVIK